MREIALVLVSVVAGVLTACARKAPVDPTPPPACGGAPAGPAAEPARAPRPILQGAHAAAVTSMRFSPGGRYLATASDDETIKVWDAEQRSMLRTYRVLQSDRFANIQVEWDGEERLVYTQFLGTPVALDLATGAARERDDWGMAPMVPIAGGGWAGYLYEDTGEVRKQLFLVTLDARGQRTRRRVPGRLTQLVASRDGTALAGSSRWSSKHDPSDGQVVVWRDGGEEVIDTGGEVVGPIALTPGGDALVAGVPVETGWAVRVFPRGAAAGPARCELREKKDAGDVQEIAVSGNGRLAAGAVSGASSSSIVLWDLVACREVWRVDEAETRAVVRVAFAPGDARLVAGGELGEMRTFDVDGGRERGAFGAVVRPVHELAFTGDDTLVVRGIRDVRAWSLREGRALGRVVLPEGRPSHRILDAGEGGGLVTVSATDTRCDGGAILRVDAWPRHDALDTTPARAWPPAPGQRLELCTPSRQVDSIARGASALLAHDNETRQLAVVRLPGGEVQPLDPVPGLEPPRPADRCPRLELSPDGAWAAATCVDIAGVVLWDARSGRFERIITVDRDPALPASADAVVFARDGSAIAVGSRETVEVLALPGLERVHRVTMSGWPSALVLASVRGLLVGGGRDGTVEAFRDGTRVWGGPGDGGLVTDLAISPGAARVAAAGVEGSVRVRDAGTGSLLATLADFQDEEWVMTTPGGAFTGTTEVGDRVGWVFEDPLEYFGFEQFARFRDPALLQRRLAGEEVDITARPGRPPRVELAAGAPSGGRARLRVQVTADARVDVVRGFVEGRPVAARPLCKRAGSVELEVPLGAGVNRVSVAAFDARGLASNLASIDLRGPERAAAPDAWVVAVGVSDYPRLPRSMQLAAADDDARGIAAAFQRMGGGGYRAVHATTLTDAAATPAAIRAALDGLAAMKPEDVAVVFFAGHGFKPDARADMVFATGRAALRPDGRGLTAETLRDHAVSWRDIARGIARARGRVVVLLDACHAGHVTQELVVANDALADGLVRQQRAGAVVFAAAKGRQQSYEIAGGRGLVLRPAAPEAAAAAAPSHGFFTGAVLRALGDPATDRNRDGALQLSEVIDDVTRRVAAASDGAQTPWIARRDLFGDFSLAPASRGR